MRGKLLPTISLPDRVPTTFDGPLITLRSPSTHAISQYLPRRTETMGTDPFMDVTTDETLDDSDPPSPTFSQSRYPFLWLTATSLSLATSKRLFEDGFHYPMYLLLFHLLATIALRILRHVFFHSPSQRRPTIELSWIHLLICAIGLAYVSAIAGSLAYGYQTILLNRYLPHVAMILALDWQLGNIWAAFLDCFELRLVYELIFRLSLRLFGVAMIFGFQVNINERDTKTLLGALGLSVLAQLVGMLYIALRLWASTTSRRSFVSDSWGRYLKLDITTLALLCALPVTIFGIRSIENRGKRGHDLPWPGSFMLIVNVAASALALDSSVAFFRNTDCPCKPPTPAGERGLCSFLGHRLHDGILLPMLLVGLTMAFATIFCHQPPVVSLGQFAGFLLAIMASITVADVANGVDLLRNARNLVRSDNKSSSPSSRFFLLLLACSGLAVWPFVLVRPVSSTYTSHLANVTLDHSYRAANNLDVVVSRFAESREDLVTTLGGVMGEIRSQHPRIFIYDKASNIDHDKEAFEVFKEDLSALGFTDVIVKALDNNGREADAYLDHITSQWDHLANHTLFMQADIHEMDMLTQRLRDYYVPSTGFLSLSYAGSFCASCTGCADLSWWREMPQVLGDLYSGANHGAQCQDVVLTYRGQFIVSAARLRGNHLSMYRDLRRKLVDPHSEMHTPSYTSKHPDTNTLNSPVFGYTLERMWGVVMQCSDLRIAFTCPDLASSAPLLGSLNPEACQCYD